MPDRASRVPGPDPALSKPPVTVRRRSTAGARVRQMTRRDSGVMAGLRSTRPKAACGMAQPPRQAPQLSYRAPAETKPPLKDAATIAAATARGCTPGMIISWGPAEVSIRVLDAAGPCQAGKGRQGRFQLKSLLGSPQIGAARVAGKAAAEALQKICGPVSICGCSGPQRIRFGAPSR